MKRFFVVLLVLIVLLAGVAGAVYVWLGAPPVRSVGQLRDLVEGRLAGCPEGGVLDERVVGEELVAACKKQDAFHGAFNATWEASGRPSAAGEYVDGRREGLWTSWHPNGRKKEEATYRDGELNGPLTRWDRDGSKLAERLYRDGKQILRPVDEELLEAARAGAAERVVGLLERGADPGAAPLDRPHQSALQLAVESRQAGAVRALLASGADARTHHSVAEKTAAPLVTAVRNQDVDLARLLLEHDADPNTPLSTAGDTVLMLAARQGDTRLVAELLGRKADINAEAEVDGRKVGSALTEAVRGRHRSTVQLLLKRGASCHARSDRGLSAVDLADELGYDGILEVFDRGYCH